MAAYRKEKQGTTPRYETEAQALVRFRDRFFEQTLVSWGGQDGPYQLRKVVVPASYKPTFE
jgi:hypothetical protein